MQQPTDFSHLAQLAQSQAGRQLMALLQQSGGDALQKAVTAAATGDYSQAQSVLATLLNTPEAKALLQQLEGNP